MDRRDLPLFEKFRVFNEELETLYADYFGDKNTLISPNSAFWIPNTDIYENDTELVIMLEVAGVDKDKIEVRMENNVLSIMGNRLDYGKEDKRLFHTMEICFGLFRKDVVLSHEIDSSTIQASYENGILIIRCKKIIGTDKVFEVKIH